MNIETNEVVSFILSGQVTISRADLVRMFQMALTASPTAGASADSERIWVEGSTHLR